MHPYCNCRKWSCETSCSGSWSWVTACCSQGIRQWHCQWHQRYLWCPWSKLLLPWRHWLWGKDGGSSLPWLTTSFLFRRGRMYPTLHQCQECRQLLLQCAVHMQRGEASMKPYMLALLCCGRHLYRQHMQQSSTSFHKPKLTLVDSEKELWGFSVRRVDVSRPGMNGRWG